MFVGYEADDWQDTAAKDIRYPVKIGGSHSGGSAGDTSTERACISVAPVLPPYLRTGLAKHGDSMVHIYNTQFRIMPDRASKKRLAQLVEKGPVVDTGTQRGAAKYASEIVARTGCHLHSLSLTNPSVTQP